MESHKNDLRVTIVFHHWNNCAVPELVLTQQSTQQPPKPVTWLTQEAYDRLQSELEHLSGPGRAEITARIEAAREEGDLRENGGYHAAKEEQGKQEAPHPPAHRPAPHRQGRRGAVDRPGGARHGRRSAIRRW